jgi:hypothetical protein
MDLFLANNLTALLYQVLVKSQNVNSNKARSVKDSSCVVCDAMSSGE